MVTPLSPTTLSARLKTLEEKGVVSKELYEEHPPRFEYTLTEKGKELRFALNALRKWGERHTG
jgi:DNA-binding HxlR family transcriptional regulator